MKRADPSESIAPAFINQTTPIVSNANLNSATIALRMNAMPTLARFSQSTITMYAGDHLPPHFHVRMSDGREALVAIATLEVLRGTIAKRELSEALAWAKENQAALAAKWKELNP